MANIIKQVDSFNHDGKCDWEIKMKVSNDEEVRRQLGGYMIRSQQMKNFILRTYYEKYEN